LAKSTWTFISNRASGKLKQGWHYLWKKKAKHIPCSLEKKKHGQPLNYQWSRTDWIGSTPYSARYIVDASFMTKWLFTIQRKARESFQIYCAGILPALTWFRVRAGIIPAKCGFCHVKEPTILSTWRFSQEVITYCFHCENLTETLIRYHEDFDTHPTLMITFVFHNNWKPWCTRLHILSILSPQMKKTKWNRTLFLFRFEIEEWSILVSQLCFLKFSRILCICLIMNCT